jgi:hypothetical protein
MMMMMMCVSLRAALFSRSHVRSRIYKARGKKKKKKKRVRAASSVVIIKAVQDTPDAADDAAATLSELRKTKAKPRSGS